MKTSQSKTYEGTPCSKGHTLRRVKGGHCVACSKLTSDSWYANNKKAVSARNKLRYEGKREILLQYSRDWYADNRERRLTSSKQWYNNNREHRVEVSTAYRRANRIVAHRYRSAEGHFTEVDINELFSKQEGECAAKSCNKFLYSFHIDHKKPVSKGGSNWPSNLQLLCATCNLRKGNKTMEEWCDVA